MTSICTEVSVDRYYDPATGQFLTLDPLVATTTTPYVYAADDPVNIVDPSGDMPACTFDPSLCSLNATKVAISPETGLTECEQGLYKTLLGKAAINAYIGDYPALNTRFFSQHKWQLMLIPPIAAAGITVAAVACAAGVCEALGAAGGVLAAQQAVQDAEDEGWGVPAELSSEAQATYDDIANNLNNLDHIFTTGHGWSTAISEFGDKFNVLKALAISINQETDLMLEGASFKGIPVVIGNSVVSVNGAYLNGIVRISTARVIGS